MVILRTIFIENNCMYRMVVLWLNYGIAPSHWNKITLPEWNWHLQMESISRYRF